MLSINKDYQHLMLYNQPEQLPTGTHKVQFLLQHLDSACGQVHILSQVLVSRILICTLR